MNDELLENILNFILNNMGNREFMHLNKCLESRDNFYQQLTKTQSLLGEAVELLKWLYEREEHINEVNNAVENFIRKYEGQKGE